MISYLLISDDKKSINNYLNKIINKQDIFIKINIEEGKKEYSINQIKNIIHEANIYSNKRKIYFFEDFHLSSIETQNSFLKLLEEPPSNVFFILTTNNELKILPTIISRVKLVYLRKNKTITINDDKKKLIDNLIKSKNLLLISTEKIDLNDLLIYFRSQLKMINDKKEINKIILLIKRILNYLNLIENNNLNKQMAMDNVLIEMRRIDVGDGF